MKEEENLFRSFLITDSSMQSSFAFSLVQFNTTRYHFATTVQTGTREMKEEENPGEGERRTGL